MGIITIITLTIIITPLGAWIWTSGKLEQKCDSMLNSYAEIHHKTSRCWRCCSWQISWITSRSARVSQQANNSRHSLKQATQKEETPKNCIRMFLRIIKKSKNWVRKKTTPMSNKIAKENSCNEWDPSRSPMINRLIRLIIFWFKSAFSVFIYFLLYLCCCCLVLKQVFWHFIL